MGENNQEERPLSYGEINKELDALEDRNDPESNERRAGLLDELMRIDMGMGGFRQAMGNTVIGPPSPADATSQPADEQKPAAPADS